jgi:hypothetical protein
METNNVLTSINSFGILNTLLSHKGAKYSKTSLILQWVPYGIAVDTAKAVDTAVVLQFYFMSTAKMQ